MDISLVDGIWRAWIPDEANPAAGRLTYGRTEEELYDKLTAALGGLGLPVPSPHARG